MDPRFGQQMPMPPMGGMPPNMYGAPPYGAPPMMYAPPPMGMMPPNGPMMGPPMGGGPKMPPRSGNPALDDKVTTVWVGRITPGVGDDAIKKLLEKCGELASWKRLPDATTGQLKTFGFADFKNAQGALRAVKLLSDLFLGDKNLQLKVDEKTQRYLDGYTQMKKEMMDKQKNPNAPPATADGGFTAAELEFDPELLDLKKQIADTVSEYHRAYGIDERKMRQRAQEEQSRNERSDKNDREKNKAREEEEARRREEREKEREERRKERAEREFRTKEREWEGHEKDREKEKERRIMMERERLKLRMRNIEVDEQDDRQHRRKIRSREKRRDRQRELEEDERERLAELEELEQKRIEEERRLEAERRRREEEIKQEEEAQRRDERSGASPATLNSPLGDSSSGFGSAPLKLGIKLNSSTGGAAPNKKVASGWQEADEPEQHDAIKKKKPLVPLDFGGVDKKTKSEELKSVIEKIPTDKDQLFNYTIDWDAIDQHSIIQQKMRPWITKKITEYFGEEDETFTLVEYICKKLAEHSKPLEILEQLRELLDEAETFVVRMWRMLIFEMLRSTSA